MLVSNESSSESDHGSSESNHTPVRRGGGLLGGGSFGLEEGVLTVLPVPPVVLIVLGLDVCLSQDFISNRVHLMHKVANILQKLLKSVSYLMVDIIEVFFECSHLHLQIIDGFHEGFSSSLFIGANRSVVPVLLGLFTKLVHDAENESVDELLLLSLKLRAHDDRRVLIPEITLELLESFHLLILAAVQVLHDLVVMFHVLLHNLVHDLSPLIIWDSEFAEDILESRLGSLKSRVRVPQLVFIFLLVVPRIFGLSGVGVVVVGGAVPGGVVPGGVV